MPALAALLHDAGLPVPGGVGVEVTRLVSDSRDATPGALFVAISGLSQDGHAHAAAAVAGGAVAVVAERPPQPEVQVPVILVENSRMALSALAAAIHGHPSRELTVAGVTGTDGKTTTATMIWAAWRAGGRRAGLVSTVEVRDGDNVMAREGRLTTAEAPQTQARLAQLRDSGCTHVALETSSHALALHRVDDVAFRVAVYTRITSEHLDLHGTREAYLAAKARLAELVSHRDDGIAVLDADDDFAHPRLRAIPVAARLDYSVAGARADLAATDIRSQGPGVAFTARTPWGVSPVRLQLAGRFNAANALAAIGAACSTGTALADAVAGLEGLPRVSGRMERVDAGQPFTVVVDYAHTTAALASVLAELRAITGGHLWVVFGSAGDRDRGKRAPMGDAAARGADRVVVTDEDPRTESREAICAEIAAGAEAAGARPGETLWVIPDRREAVAFAIERAQPSDVVLLAGKGHERSIIQGETATPWDEREAALEALAAAGYALL
ncbi:MAG: UDP-N-acetylmuramoyl-L-alanyl-D-glutamate--2,6-diaminopimelate ligase [Candidatus Dormibacteria bacterium]